MTVKSLLYISIICVFLQACADLGTRDYDVMISVDEPNRIRFSGKGAGAGMMLSSSMGPMGIAVGVAIDEGISKDIDKNAKQGGFSIETIVHSAFLPTKQDLELTIHRYGFTLVPGSENVVVELVLTVKQDESSTKLKYPVKPSEIAPVEWPLEEIKTNADSVIEAFEAASQVLALQYLKAD